MEDTIYPLIFEKRLQFNRVMAKKMRKMNFNVIFDEVMIRPDLSIFFRNKKPECLHILNSYKKQLNKQYCFGFLKKLG